jgi:PAS domain S-box-containing protein
MATQQKVPGMSLKGISVHGALPQLDYDLRDLMESLAAAIYTCDKEGKITFYNEAAADLWGRRPEIGKDLWTGSWKMYNPDGSSLDPDKCPMAVALKENYTVKGEEIIVERPDGVRVHVLSHPKLIFDRKGKVTGAINLLVDITEKKKTEAALHKSENKYRHLSESLEEKVAEKISAIKDSEDRYHKMIDEVQDYAILLLDHEGTILNWNKGAEKIKGYAEAEVTGKNFRIFYTKEDRDRKLPEQLIAEAIEKGKAMHEGWRVRKNGSIFWGSIVITALHDEHRNIIGFTKVTRDLTEKKIAEDQLKQYSRELEAQNKELEQYAYVASHDLQEPLRKIQLFSEQLEKSIDDKTAALKNLSKINSAARRMSLLIKDVLKYSQLSKTGEHFELTDLNKVMENVKEDFDLLIQQKGAVIRNDDMPVIKGIPIQLHQLFSNLVGNAIKFTNGNPMLEITWTKFMNSKEEAHPKLDNRIEYYKIVFKDNGIGFESQYADQIFKLFQRLNENTYGTGIGLALCKKIVENHNGCIEVSSKPGKGTTFNIFLPASINPVAISSI